MAKMESNGLGHDVYIGATPANSNIQGAILGAVEVTGCIQNSPSPWAERGAWHWQLSHPQRLLTPISCKGKFGLWNVNFLILQHPELERNDCLLFSAPVKFLNSWPVMNG